MHLETIILGFVMNVIMNCIGFSVLLNICSVTIYYILYKELFNMMLFLVIFLTAFFLFLTLHPTFLESFYFFLPFLTYCCLNNPPRPVLVCCNSNNIILIVLDEGTDVSFPPFEPIQFNVLYWRQC